MKIQVKPLAAALMLAGSMIAPSIASADAQVSKHAAKSTKNAAVKSKEYKLTGKELRDLIRDDHDDLPFDLDVPGRAYVSTGPYTGVPFQFSGNDLVVNSPSVDKDVQLLTIRKSIWHKLKKMGLEATKEPSHSHLLLSGVVEASAKYSQRGRQSATSDINISNVSLDAFFMGPTNWLLGFIELTYNDGTPASDVFASPSTYRIGNSRVYVGQAFITAGDFSLSPIYATVGQFYVPFGVYSSVMVSSPLTKSLTRTKARAALLGYHQQDPNSSLYGSVYTFRGDSRVSAAGKVNNGGINIGYKFKNDKVRGKIGGGVIANIADSSGMQSTNIQNVERLVHRVPGYNARALFSVANHFNFIGEFVTASTSFNPGDLSYNMRGAKPWAYDLEFAYSTELLGNHPSSVGVGYSETHEALALGLPKNRISLVFNTSVWRNTLQSIEFKRELNYSASDTASASGLATPAASGRSDHAVTAQFDYYF